MENVRSVHELVCNFEGEEYVIEVFLRPDGKHFARTVFSQRDVIISDGVSLEEVLHKHQELLPLAIHSRKMLFSSRTIN